MRYWLSYSGWLVIAVLCVIPVILWRNALLWEVRVGGAGAIWLSLGNVAGLVGITLFAVNLILSARISWMEDAFGGMNKVYVVHHIVGGLAFVLLLFHPVLTAFSRLPISVKAVALYILPGNSWTINFGIAALLLMMALLIVTFFADLPYEIWRLTHKFMGAAFLIGVIHALFIDSDISRYLPLKIYMAFVIFVSLGCYLYRTVLGRWLVLRAKYKVEGVKKVGPGVVEVKMRPWGTVKNFKPGQFVFVSFRNGGVSSEVHPFSVASSPKPDGEIIIVSKVEGDFTKELMGLRIGATAVIEGAFGRFIYTNFSKGRQVWIAGGIGVTPFLAMVQTLTQHPDYKVDFYYCVKDESEAVYLKELKKWQATLGNFRMILHYSNEDGRISAESISRTSGNIMDCDIFLCGPPAMMYSLRQQFRHMGVKSSRTHSEEFTIL